ncbi:hypothetical protein CQA53_01865 [Helicobacter didelphidarum]|uniref:beta-lactamase n=1 Tax=Helicobacter didelphidarum TaxID=2040648 RepID=A0A3D8IP85_9HELI|nr:tetratricopeptide repeat protein [Helicobacter didelphidarum]RDU67032.1 hypothetical protein CQA53_01865 [Helicobacter didelphidarum]
MKKKLICLFVFSIISLYGYSQNLINECNQGYSKSCLALMWQAKDLKDTKNFALYQEKVINMLDKACAKDFQACLMLANMYGDEKTALHISQMTNAMKDNTDSSKNKTIQSKQVFSQKLVNSQGLNVANKERSNSESIFSNSTLQIFSVVQNAQKVLHYQEQSIPLLETACYYNDNVQACVLLSYFSEYGIATAQNRPKAKRLFDLALDISTRKCMLENESACDLLDVYPNYQQEIAENIADLERKCEENDSLSCWRAMLYYTQGYYTGSHKQGHEDKSDFVKSAHLLQKVCKLDKKHCENTIFQHKNAKECLLKNNMTACRNVEGSNKVEFLSLACDSGDLQSCYALRSLPLFQETKRYIKLLQRMCRGGVIEACTELADIYRDGKRVAKDLKKSLSFSQRACNWSIKNQSDGGVCEYAGIGYEEGKYVKQDIQKAIESYRYACLSAKYGGSACGRLGNLYEKYKGNPKDTIQWHIKACEGENISVKSCNKVAQAYFRGDLLPQDINKAIEIYDKILMNNQPHKEDAYFALANIYSQDTIYSHKTQTMEENEFLDYAKSLIYYRKACEMGLESACDIQVVFKDIAQECFMGNYNSCYQVASTLELLQDSYYKGKIKLDIENIRFDSAMLPNSSLSNFPNKELDSHAISLLSNQLYIRACRYDVAQACKRAYSLGLAQIQNMKNLQSQDSKNMEFYKGICKYIEKEKVKSICIEVAKYALNNQEYAEAIWALESFNAKNDIEPLNLITMAYFYTKEYVKLLDTYKLIYKYGVPSDYYYLGVMYEDGLGVRQNYLNASRIYSVSHSARGYYGLARMFEYGLGVYRDFGRAKDLYQVACPLDIHSAQNPTISFSYTGVSSESDEPLGSDVANVETYEDKSFGLGFEKYVSPLACVKLGNLQKQDNNLKQAQQYFIQACEFGYNGNEILCENILK